MVDFALQRAKCFSLLKILVEVPFPFFQSVFQRARERKRILWTSSLSKVLLKFLYSFLKNFF